jgi:hypothetical protein
MPKPESSPGYSLICSDCNYRRYWANARVTAEAKAISHNTKRNHEIKLETPEGIQMYLRSDRLDSQGKVPF